MLANNLLVSTLGRTYSLLPKAYRKQAFGVLILVFFSSLLELLGLAIILPLVTLLLQDGAVSKNRLISPVYKALGSPNETVFVTCLALTILGLILFKNVISLVITKYQTAFTYKVYKYFSIQLFRFYHAKGLAYLNENNPNFIVRNMFHVPLEFTNNVALNILSLISELLILSLLLFTILLYDAKIVLLLVVVILPVFALFYKFVKNKIQDIQHALNEVGPLVSKNAFESIYGYVDIQMLGVGKHFSSKHHTLLDESLALRVKDKVYQQAPTKVVESAMIATIVIITLYGVLYLKDKSQLVALISVFALAAYRVLPSINRVMIAVLGIKGFSYTFSILEQIKEIDENFADDIGEVDEQTQAPEFRESIKFCDVSFSYDGQTDVLKHVDLNIGKGRTVGIIGRSGSGKSTLISLLLGFYEPGHGHIEIDGVEATRDKKRWRKLIGYVPQDIFLLDATLLENIAFGREPEKVDLEEVKRVLEIASLTELVAGLKDGIHTRVGDRGVFLSGGQKQRIGIARALYSGAKILVFDEATSALDDQTESEITESIRMLSDGGITNVIIAHRHSSLKYCNSVYRISEGQLTEVSLDQFKQVNTLNGT
jgi:ABC-type multidrug transport system fused ATPase/permease subunit